MRQLSLTGVLTALAGSRCSCGSCRQVGVAQIEADVRQVGWGLVAIIAIGGLRFLVRALAWRLCLEAPHTPAHRRRVRGGHLRRRDRQPHAARSARRRAGQGGVRARRIPLAPAATALAIENVFYTLSAAAMIAAGMVALLFEFQLPPASAARRRVAIAASRRAVRDRAVAAVAAAGARQPRALGLAPGVACRRRPTDRGADLQVRRPAPIGGVGRDARGGQLPRARRRGSPPDALAARTAARRRCSPLSFSRRRTG